MAITDGDKRLYFLHDLEDYKVASDQPDVRGWKLMDTNQEEIGTVDNLIIDIKKEKVRYLDVALHESIASDNPAIKGDLANRKDDDHVIIPIGLARLDADKACVVVDDVHKETFQRTPRFNKGVPIGADYEYAVSEALASPQAGMNKFERPIGTATPDEFYDNDQFNEEKFYRKKSGS